jgi:uncharacterized membrane protein YheB (UPF0754 family)
LSHSSSSRQVETETDESLLQAINKIENDIKKKDGQSYINILSNNLVETNNALSNRVQTESHENSQRNTLQMPIPQNFKTLQKYDLSHFRVNEASTIPQKGNCCHIFEFQSMNMINVTF